MRQALLGGVMQLLAGCSGPPAVSMASQALDAAGKQFNPPPAGMAAVYFYNPTSSGPVINLTVGAMVIGSLAPNSWMRIELSPGWHAMTCSTHNSVNPSSITLAPGHMRFIDVEMPPDAPACSLQEAGRDAGRAGVLAGSRAKQIQ